MRQNANNEPSSPSPHSRGLGESPHFSVCVAHQRPSPGGLIWFHEQHKRGPSDSRRIPLLFPSHLQTGARSALGKWGL
eukprot:7917405-Karenia_brevis.AAC.1